MFVSPQSSLEHDVYSRLTSLQEGLIPKKRAGADDELHRINELIQVRVHTHTHTQRAPMSKGIILRVQQTLDKHPSMPCSAHTSFLDARVTCSAVSW